MSYEEKYLKYKNKYVLLKNMIGGGCAICGNKAHTNASCPLANFMGVGPGIINYNPLSVPIPSDILTPQKLTELKNPDAAASAGSPPYASSITSAGRLWSIGVDEKVPDSKRTPAQLPIPQDFIEIMNKLSVVNPQKFTVLKDAMFNLLLKETTREEILDLQPNENLVYMIDNTMYIIFKDNKFIKLLDLNMVMGALVVSLVDFPASIFTRNPETSFLPVVNNIFAFLKDKIKPYNYKEYLKGIELTTLKNFI